MTWDAWLTLGVTVTGFLALLWRTSAVLGDLRSQGRQTLKSVRSLMESNSFLLGALTSNGVLSSEQVRSVLNPFEELARGSLADMICAMKPHGNPVTAEDLRSARDMLSTIRQWLETGKIKQIPLQEAEELLRVAKMIRDESPDDSLRQELVELAAFLIGAASKAPDGP